MTEYVHVGTHADVLASGRHIGPGERVTDKDLNLDESDRVLLAEGVLVDVASFGTGPLTKDELVKRAGDLNIEGRSKMSVDELRQAVAEGGANAA